MLRQKIYVYKLPLKKSVESMGQIVFIYSIPLIAMICEKSTSGGGISIRLKLSMIRNKSGGDKDNLQQIQSIHSASSIFIEWGKQLRY